MKLIFLSSRTFNVSAIFAKLKRTSCKILQSTRSKPSSFIEDSVYLSQESYIGQNNPFPGLHTKETYFSFQQLSLCPMSLYGGVFLPILVEFNSYNTQIRRLKRRNRRLYELLVIHGRHRHGSQLPNFLG